MWPHTCRTAHNLATNFSPSDRLQLALPHAVPLDSGGSHRSFQPRLQLNVYVLHSSGDILRFYWAVHVSQATVSLEFLYNSDIAVLSDPVSDYRNICWIHFVTIRTSSLIFSHSSLSVDYPLVENTSIIIRFPS